jgi:1-aminocyclopropane-1-carboxylate deaminase/D-cysteine desulfhydrase-like pyridoxal-dependent ACC family enzyme
VQSNHTRQVAAVAARSGLKARLVQEHWVDWLHGILMLDPEPGRVEPHIRAHQPRQLDVARALVARVSIGGVQSNHTRQVAAVAARSGLKARLVQEHWVGDGGDLARVVALHAADGDEGRAALGLGVRE